MAMSPSPIPPNFSVGTTRNGTFSESRYCAGLHPSVRVGLAFLNVVAEMKYPEYSDSCPNRQG